MVLYEKTEIFGGGEDALDDIEAEEINIGDRATVKKDGIVLTFEVVLDEEANEKIWEFIEGTFKKE